MTASLERRLEALEAVSPAKVRTSGAVLVLQDDGTLRPIYGPRDYRDQLPGEGADDYVQWLEADGWMVIVIEYVAPPVRTPD